MIHKYTHCEVCSYSICYPNIVGKTPIFYKNELKMIPKSETECPSCHHKFESWIDKAIMKQFEQEFHKEVDSRKYEFKVVYLDFSPTLLVKYKENNLMLSYSIYKHSGSDFNRWDKTYPKSNCLRFDLKTKKWKKSHSLKNEFLTKKFKELCKENDLKWLKG